MIVDNRSIIIIFLLLYYFYIPSSTEFAVNSRVFLSFRKEERKKEIIYLFEIIHLPRQNLLDDLLIKYQLKEKLTTN